MMVLNEPETSLHPDLLPALAQLIAKVADKTQVWVVTHSPALMSALGASPETRVIELEPLVVNISFSDHKFSVLASSFACTLAHSRPLWRLRFFSKRAFNALSSSQ